MEKPNTDNEREMDEFRMQIKAIEEQGDGAGDGEAEFARLTKELDELSAEMDSIKERKKKMQLIGDQVGGWTARVAQKLTD